MVGLESNVYAEYHQLADELGLRMPTEPGMMTLAFSLFGELEGQPVTLRRLCGSGARVDITSPLRPHLDLGFGLTRAGAFSKVSEWLGAHDIQTGDAAFDAAFTVRGDEPARVLALLTPEVRSAIASIGVADFELSDAEYSCGHRVTMGGDESVETLARELREAARMARAVAEAHAAVPPAGGLVGHHEAWSAYARQRQLQSGATPLWLQGQLGKTWVFAQASRIGVNDFALTLGARLQAPLPIPLGIEPKRGLIGSLVGARAESTGDSAFDAVFEVTCAEGSLRVGAELRSLLLELSQLGKVRVRGSEVRLVTPASLKPERVPGVLEDLCRALAQLEEDARGPRAAYR
ncbi:MAG: hypothetical protein IPM35_36065 [Myxococcales bacterium]|nr:hypothetical protein [Myxococcales bacterium]